MNARLFSVLAMACALCSVRAATNDSGWIKLFNGKDFTGWYLISGQGAKNEDPNRLFQIHDGMVHMYKDAPDGSRQPHGYMITEKEYSHYHLRFEYKWGSKKFAPRAEMKRDCGLLYHVFGKDGVWPKSVECQVQEGDTGDIFTVSTRIRTTVDPHTTNPVPVLVTNAATGAVRTNLVSRPVFQEARDGGVETIQGTAQGIRRVLKSPMNEKEGWNTVEVIVRGDSATHIVNGVVNNRLWGMEKMEGDQWVPLTQGKLLLQKEGAEVFYRNIEIRLLDPKQSPVKE